jgi:hypothetical protein
MRTRSSSSIACMLAMLAFEVAHSQPFSFEPTTFEPSLLEARQRNESQYEGFTYKFDENAEVEGFFIQDREY